MSTEEVVFIPPGNASVMSVSIGVGMVALMVPGLMANGLVIAAIVSGGLLGKRDRVIYRAVLTLLVCDTVQLLNVAGIGLASAAQDILVPQWAYRLPGLLFLWMWQESWFVLTFIAVNRYVALVHPSRWAFLSQPGKVTAYLGGSWVASLGTLAISQAALPCCRFVVYPEAYTLSWMGPEEKGGSEILWSDWLVEWPGNSVTTLAILFSYVGILRFVRASNRAVGAAVERDSQARRRRQEQRFAFQFMAISSFFIACTVIFRLFPLIVPAGEPQWFAVLSYCLVLNSSVNSYIYLAYNEEVRRAVGRLVGGGSADADVPLNNASAKRTSVYPSERQQPPPVE